MKFALNIVALGAIAASVLAAPIEVEKRATTGDIISACFVGLIFTGAWPGSCKAAVAVNIGLIKGITINQMSMDFTPTNPWAPKLSSSSLVATMLSIPGITLPINAISQNVLIADNGSQVGTFSSPFAPASVKGSALTTTIPSSTFNVFSTSQSAFQTFISKISSQATYSLTLQGSVDAKLNLGIFGTMTIPGIGFSTSVPIAGLNGLKTINYIYLISIDTSTSIFTMATVVTIPNPSQLTLTLGDVSFSTATSEGYVGISTIHNLVLTPGLNYAIALTTLDSSLQSVNDMLNGIYTANVPLYLTGYGSTSANTALNAGLSSLNSTLTIPAAFVGSTMSQAPYKNWSIKVTPGSDHTKVLQLTVTFQSPYYGFPVTIVHAQDSTNDWSASAALSTTTNPVFVFEDNLSVSVPGTGSTTVSFNVALPSSFGSSQLPNWQKIVNYASANGYIPITMSFMPSVIVNNDGVERVVDWGNDAAGLTTINVATGSDFASILTLL